MRPTPADRDFAHLAIILAIIDIEQRSDEIEMHQISEIPTVFGEIADALGDQLYIRRVTPIA